LLVVAGRLLTQWAAGKLLARALAGTGQMCLAKIQVVAHPPKTPCHFRQELTQLL
jgi:hypothetical protein